MPSPTNLGIAEFQVSLRSATFASRRPSTIRDVPPTCPISVRVAPAARQIASTSGRAAAAYETTTREASSPKSSASGRSRRLEPHPAAQVPREAHLGERHRQAAVGAVVGGLEQRRRDGEPRPPSAPPSRARGRAAAGVPEPCRARPGDTRCRRAARRASAADQRDASPAATKPGTARLARSRPPARPSPIVGVG